MYRSPKSLVRAGVMLEKDAMGVWNSKTRKYEGHLDEIHHTWILDNDEHLLACLRWVPAEEITSCLFDISDYKYFVFSALHMAVKRGDIKMLRNLLDEGTDPNGNPKTYRNPTDKGSVGAGERGWLSRTPLHPACQSLNIEMVELLLQRGASPNGDINIY
jgi:hypothetical protein